MAESRQKPRIDVVDLSETLEVLFNGVTLARSSQAKVLFESSLPARYYVPAADLVHGDKGCDSNAVRREIEAKGAAPNIPPKRSTAAGKAASRLTCTAAATASSACSTG